ncbi:MAG: hypothetical protein ABI175_03915 [Polyangiales bacterium]
MSSRLAGAILALTAAALLALSLVTSAWWAGHPEVDGRTIELKTVHVGLHGAEGCNTGGDGGCTSLTMPGGFEITGYIALGVVGILTIAAILLGISTLRSAEGRKTLAKLVIGLMAGAALVAIVLIVQGPKMTGSARQISIPIGYGMFVFWIGGVTAVAGAVLAMRPLPKPELRPSRAAYAPGLDAPPSPSQPVDMMALLQQDALRPAALGPEPMMGRAVAPPAGAGLAGPAGPLGAGSGHSPPLFNAAPGLRPLYDNDPNMGGSGGYVPLPQPRLPSQGPMPVPRASVAAMAGIPTPASIAVQEPPSRTTSMGPAVGPPPPPPSRMPMIPPPRSVSPTAPPVPSLPNCTRPQSVPPPPGAISARLKASSVPPPVRPGMQVPTTPQTLAGTMMPPPPSYKLPVRAVSDPGDLGETIDRDAMKTLDRGDEAAVQVGRPSTNGEVGDSTDASVALPEAESTDVRAPLDTEEAPIVRPPTEGEEAETNAIEKQTLDVDTGVQEKVEPEPLAAVAAEPAAASTSAPKIPITTAPDSLPPPTEKQAATSGPSPACPQCEAPMAWVEEHLRFYCKSCRMYF